MKLLGIVLVSTLIFANPAMASNDWIDVSSQIPETKEQGESGEFDDNLVRSRNAEKKDAGDSEPLEIKDSEPLGNLIVDDQVLRKQHKEKRLKSLKTRKLYDPKSQMPPRILQQNLKQANNAHIPEITYSPQYSTMLFRAIEKGDIGAVSSLLSQYANINFKFEPSGITPLMFALMNMHARIAQYLILKGADVNIATNEGVTALHIAAYNKDIEVVDLLLDSGADMYVRDGGGLLPLEYLPAEHQSAIMVRHAQNPQELQKVFWGFVRQNNPIGIKMAIDAGATTEQYNAEGNTPLIEAAKLGLTASVKALLANGAVPIAVSKSNAMALDYAVLAGNTEMSRILENSYVEYELRNDLVRPVSRYAYLYTHGVLTSHGKGKMIDAKSEKTVILKPNRILPKNLD
jgi:ankyrin repeat protein